MTFSVVKSTRLGYLNLMNKNFDPDEFSDTPLRESSSPIWDFERHRGKYLNIHRWLRSHVGQHWSDIQSEWTDRKKSGCEEAKDYLNRRVDLNCTAEGGKYFDSKGSKVTSGFVVIDDILYEIKPRRRWKPRSLVERRWDHKVVWKDNKVFACIKSIWYELKLEEVVWKNTLEKKDMFLNNLVSDFKIRHQSIGEANLRRLLYGKENLYCSAKHQLNKKEILKLRLRELER